MPAGELYSHEIRSSEPPEDLHRRVVVQLSPLLAPAKYKLAAQDAQNVEYSRRYVPRATLVAGLAAWALAAVLVAGGDYGFLTEGLVAAGAALLVVRRREQLIVTIQPRPGGSSAVLSGVLTPRARMFLLGFDPPRGRRVRLAAGHPSLARGLPGRPSAG
ncbi:MAG TPA: hypothetical protein VI111_11295 [Thermoleophilaceae bacterium]